MFEFQAGGGKTKVISAIIAAKASIEGKNAVFFSLPELFDITKKDLREALERAFKMKLNIININLQTNLDVDALERLCKILEESKSKGTTHILTPEAYHALNLAYQTSLSQGDVKKVGWISRIDYFFRTQGIALIDESHRNADSLLQANKAIGDPRKLSENEKKLLLNIFDVLTGEKDPDLLLKNDPEGRALKDVLSLRQNQQASLSEDEFKMVIDTLADEIIKMPMLQIQSQHIPEMIAYLKNPNLSPPKWLVEANEQGLEMAKLHRVGARDADGNFPAYPAPCRRDGLWGLGRHQR